MGDIKSAGVAEVIARGGTGFYKNRGVKGVGDSVVKDICGMDAVSGIEGAGFERARVGGGNVEKGNGDGGMVDGGECGFVGSF